MVQKELDNILQQFPEFRARIVALFNSNEDFKSLCDDYFQCGRSVQMIRENLQLDARMESVYKQLLQELRSDLLRWLDK